MGARHMKRGMTSAMAMLLPGIGAANKHGVITNFIRGTPSESDLMLNNLNL